MVYDGYVKYEEAGINRSAIMQDLQDSEKKKKKLICHGLSLGETLHFVLYSWPSHFAFLELRKYYKIQNSR